MPKRIYYYILLQSLTVEKVEQPPCNTFIERNLLSFFQVCCSEQNTCISFYICPRKVPMYRKPIMPSAIFKYLKFFDKFTFSRLKYTIDLLYLDHGKKLIKPEWLITKSTKDIVSKNSLGKGVEDVNNVIFIAFNDVDTSYLKNAKKMSIRY